MYVLCVRACVRFFLSFTLALPTISQALSRCRFEVNAMLRCRKKGEAMGGMGKQLTPHVCQIFNGIVNHEEIDQ